MVDYKRLFGEARRQQLQAKVAKEAAPQAKPINSTSTNSTSASTRSAAMNSLKNRLRKEVVPSEDEKPISDYPHVKNVKSQPVKTNGEDDTVSESSPSPKTSSPAFSSAIEGVEGVIADDDFEQIEREAAKEFQYPDQPEKFEEEAVAELREAFSMLANHIEDKEIVGQAIRRVMGHMQKHDFLRDLILPEDIGLMVRGLRKSAGVMIQKKAEGRKSEKKMKSELNVKAFEEALGDDFGF